MSAALVQVKAASTTLVKRAKTAEENAIISMIEQQKIKRTSNLLAPIMHLQGHEVLGTLFISQR